MNFSILLFLLGSALMFIIWHLVELNKEHTERKRDEEERRRKREATPLNWTIEKIIRADGKVTFSFSHNNLEEHWRYAEEMIRYLHITGHLTEESVLAKLEQIQSEYQNELIISTTYIAPPKKV